MKVMNATSDWCGIDDDTAAVIVTRDDQHATMWRAAVRIAVLKRVAGAINARTLAVPDAEYAIDSLVRIGFYLLRAEYCGRGEVFVNGRQEFDIVFVEKRSRAP